MTPGCPYGAVGHREEGTKIDRKPSHRDRAFRHKRQGTPATMGWYVLPTRRTLPRFIEGPSMRPMVGMWSDEEAQQVSHEEMPLGLNGPRWCSRKRWH